jgi:hypothetical protein
VCHPDDEFGPNVNLATTVFVSGVAANPTPFGTEPAPITSDTTEPVAPVATATPVKAIDAATNDATNNHLPCLNTMTSSFSPIRTRPFPADPSDAPPTECTRSCI